MKIVLTVAGSDSGAGAGIQADLKAIAANGGYGVSILTAVTAQNTRAVTMVEELSPAMIEAQFDALFEDMPIAAAKTGMLAGIPIIHAVADRFRRYRPPFLVVDPVMVSKSGHPLLKPDSIDALRTELFPLATLITPNTHEAAVLAAFPVRSLEDAERAGRAILRDGPAAVLVKGGHLAEAPGVDLLVTPDGSERVPGEWIATENTHGTGCTYSATIATYLARGTPLLEAIRLARTYVTEAVRYGLPLGRGAGPTDHFFYLRHGAPAGLLEGLKLKESAGEW